MKLYIVHHGQTDQNVEGKIQGRQDTPLNAAGRSQIEMLVRGIEKCPAIAMYSNPQVRAMETAGILARAQGVTVIPASELVEIGHNNREGRTVSGILAKERRLYEEWWQYPVMVAPSGGETLNQVDARCKKTWERIKGEMKGDTAVVVHGGTLAHFIVRLLEGQLDATGIPVGNADITTTECDPITG